VKYKYHLRASELNKGEIVIVSKKKLTHKQVQEKINSGEYDYLTFNSNLDYWISDVVEEEIK